MIANSVHCDSRPCCMKLACATSFVVITYMAGAWCSGSCARRHFKGTQQSLGQFLLERKQPLPQCTPVSSKHTMPVSPAASGALPDVLETTPLVAEVRIACLAHAGFGLSCLAGHLAMLCIQACKQTTIRPELASEEPGAIAGCRAMLHEPHGDALLQPRALQPEPLPGVGLFYSGSLHGVPHVMTQLVTPSAHTLVIHALHSSAVWLLGSTWDLHLSWCSHQDSSLPTCRHRAACFRGCPRCRSS
jgi:hypothetical protein